MSEKSEHLLDYLKRPSGYMTIVVLIITIIATFWVTSHFQDKKELTIQESQYNFLTRNEIAESDVNQHIQVYYDGKEIYDPYVIKVTIKNTGNQEITEDDFRSDYFDICFNPNVILYDASIANAVPSNIREEIILNLETQNNRLRINPFLLNVDESFTLSLITNQETDIFYNFRIAGISNTRKNINTYIYVDMFSIILFAIGFLLAIPCIISIIRYYKRNLPISSKILPLLAAALSIIVTLIAILLPFVNQTTDIAKNMQQFIFK